VSELWTITLKPDGDGPPAHVRIRRALKLLLRVCGLRCTSVKLAPADEPKHQQENVNGIYPNRGK
jgi:hypothetical protein